MNKFLDPDSIGRGIGRGGSFGQMLRWYRVVAGLTQEQLAERAGVSARGLAYLESDRRSPHRSTVDRLAEALGTDAKGRAALLAAARPLTQKAPQDHLVPSRPVTPLVGRDNDVYAALALFDRVDVRLLTLTGTGGVGKTRLALELADRVAPRFTDGVTFVWLERIRDPDFVVYAVARALEIREESRRPLLGTIIDRIREKEVLLLFDNFEHLLPAAPLLVGAIELAVPSLRIVSVEELAGRIDRGIRLGSR